MSTRYCCEIFVTEFELHRTGVEIGFAQAASNHLAETHQRGFELCLIRGVFVVGVLVADGLGVVFGRNFAIEPSASVLTSGFAGEGQSPFSEAIFQFAFFQPGQIADLLDAERVQMRSP